MQHKTQRPVRFEITQAARDALQAWIKLAGLKSEDFMFPTIGESANCVVVRARLARDIACYSKAAPTSKASTKTALTERIGSQFTASGRATEQTPSRSKTETQRIGTRWLQASANQALVSASGSMVAHEHEPWCPGASPGP